MHSPLARALRPSRSGTSAKHFSSPTSSTTRSRSGLSIPLGPRSFDLLHAVRHVSFEVAPGEFFGIVGRNGSGKSTLLKCLAGIYEIDDGVAGARRAAVAVIELGVGFNPDLTARDNVIINAIMLGLSRKQARARFDDIIAFAELEEFIELKLKNYSSGMYVRLAFATAVQVDADILLIDEVLAVGDARFSRNASTSSPASGTRAVRSCSSPMTWRPSSASATGPCCWSKGGWSPSAIRRTSRASTTR